MVSKGSPKTMEIGFHHESGFLLNGNKRTQQLFALNSVHLLQEETKEGREERRKGGEPWATVGTSYHRAGRESCELLSASGGPM